MRVSMSAMGSLMLMRSPARFRDARDLAGQRQFAEADAAQREAADEGARPTANLAAIVRLHLEARRTLRLGDHGFLGQWVSFRMRFTGAVAIDPPTPKPPPSL